MPDFKKLKFSIKIPASSEKVWQAVIGKDTYPQWTEVFCSGSNVKGEWKKGEKIWFIGPNAKESFDGMYSEIADLKEYEFISIRHLGLIQDGKEVDPSQNSENWHNVYENYYFIEQEDGSTLFEVEIDMDEKWVDYFEATWPKALERLKEISTQGFSNSVTVFNFIKAPIEKIWDCYNDPKHIVCWNFASPDWECPSAEVDLQIGGKFKSRMQAKDGSFGFDFIVIYTNVDKPNKLAYKMEDGRTAEVNFTAYGEYVKAEVRFDIEKENPREMQRQGWQSILDNFKKYTEQVYS